MISLDDRIEKIEKSLSRIETAILGDQCAGVEGLVNRVNTHDYKIKNIERMMWTVAGGAAVIIFIVEIWK